MPKQFEQEKKIVERSKKSKDLAGHFKNNPNESHYSNKTSNRDDDVGTSLFKQISKATTATFLNIQK